MLQGGLYRSRRISRWVFIIFTSPTSSVSPTTMKWLIGTQCHSGKSLAWTVDGSGFLTATLTLRHSVSTDITTYSGSVPDAGFGPPTNVFAPRNLDFLDQPWVRTE